MAEGIDLNLFVPPLLGQKETQLRDTNGDDGEGKGQKELLAEMGAVIIEEGGKTLERP
jgi:hypothetical protein